MEKQESRIFELLQKMSKSFFLPISILPFAGIFLGIGASFTNPANIKSLGLETILADGTFLNILLKIFSGVGEVVFGNLPLFFAIAVAIGLARQNKEVAAMASAVSYLVMNITVNKLLVSSGEILADGSISSDVPLGSITSVLGIQSLQIGVFGGIVVGMVVAYLHNKYYKIELPSALSFFGGTKFVPIISIIFGVFIGIFFYLFWPFIQAGISKLGNVVINSGYLGTFIFGATERGLIPFGLHHAFYLPIWTTELGGSMEVAGKIVSGAQSIYFAQLQDPNTTSFSINAVRFLVGKYPFMMGGLPGAALAMYHCVPKENRKRVKGLYLGAGLTTFLTGITEPIEFTFLFLSPLLFVIHVICAGFAFISCHVLNIAVGTTFSDGLIDFTMFGLLQGIEKTRWPLLVVLMLVYFVIYYVMFKYLIIKWDVKVPGRDNENSKLYTKADYLAKNAHEKEDLVSELIIKGLGGRENILDVDNCATRLRVTVVNGTLIDDEILKATGASGVIKRNTAIQVVYGPRVSIVKSNLDDYMSTHLEDQEITEKEFEEIKKEKELPKERQLRCDMVVPVNGELLCINKCSDEGFASKMLGDGYVLIPKDGNIYSPVDGEITIISDTKHAISISTASGDEMLIHMGLDTVNMNGEGFNILCNVGDKVKMGQKIAEVNLEKIKSQGYSTEMIFAYPELEDTCFVEVKEGEVSAGDKDKISINKK
ncbi:glucose PTS transporter subunit IIA [Caviibacter abscessus]|uniref:glucose PTS transporter subunit IIA n=1 Tax=Caviibacter abscessus TaxID=1766719 RepID=UPI000834EB25|nr:glucose PTS transporter subunit IIA [Caviibacter abscessus]